MIIDRFEGGFAVVETKDGMINVDRSFLPSDVREGDVLTCENGRYTVDRESTETIRSSVRDRLHRLLTDGDD